MRLLLIPLSILFRFIVFFRNKLYNLQVIRSKSLGCKVISVGNVSSGGTGKTPMTEYLTRYIRSRGKTVCVILKGYKRSHDDMQVVQFGYKNTEGKLTSEKVGDEAIMLTDNFSDPSGESGHIIVWDDKISAAKFAYHKFNPDAIIIDDGFQLRKLYRDLDVVMVNPHESKLMLPAGNMREPYKNIKRADIIVFNHKFQKIPDNSHKGNLSKAADAVYEFDSLINIKNETVNPGGLNIIALCGIGDPVSFKELIGTLNVYISDFIVFQDHHNFTLSDLSKIKERFEQTKADLIITTHKDFARLKYLSKSEEKFQEMKKELLLNYPLYYTKIKLQISFNEDYLIEKLDELIKEMG
jgi:tetraacyldisaccharide 4'-kinase